jgi:hypothetical protein
MMMQGCIDDSGQGHAPLFVFVASAEVWIDFSFRWRDTLDNAPLSSIALFQNI